MGTMSRKSQYDFLPIAQLKLDVCFWCCSTLVYLEKKASDWLLWCLFFWILSLWMCNFILLIILDIVRLWDVTNIFVSHAYFSNSFLAHYHSRHIAKFHYIWFHARHKSKTNLCLTCLWLLNMFIVHLMQLVAHAVLYVELVVEFKHFRYTSWLVFMKLK